MVKPDLELSKTFGLVENSSKKVVIKPNHFIFELRRVTNPFILFNNSL
jgi:hypothetical protein